MAIVPLKDISLQKNLSANLPSQNPRDFVILDNPIELESDTFWEKGTFIDIYI
jgi:hypothetical protein